VALPVLHSFPTRRSSDLLIQSIADRYQLAASCGEAGMRSLTSLRGVNYSLPFNVHALICGALGLPVAKREELAGALNGRRKQPRSEEHTSELQSRGHLVC